MVPIRCSDRRSSVIHRSLAPITVFIANCAHTYSAQKRAAKKSFLFNLLAKAQPRSPPEGEWRCMFVDEVMGAEARDGPWHTGQSHTRPQTCVDEIDVEVAY